MLLADRDGLEAAVDCDSAVVRAGVPAGDRLVGSHPARELTTDRHRDELARGRPQSSFVIAPAGEPSIGSHPAGAGRARRDRRVPARRSVCLARRVGAPAPDRLVGSQSARMPNGHRHSLELAVGRVGLRFVVVAPADDGRVGAQCARAQFSDGHFAELPLRGVAVTLQSDAPAGHGTVGADAARVPRPCRERFELPFGRVGLAVCVAAPASHGAVAAQTAGVLLTGRDCLEAPVGRFCLSLAVAAPAQDLRVGPQPAGVSPADVHRDELAWWRHWDFAQGSGQECGHLSPVDGAVGTVAQRVALAADGYARRGQCVDVGGVRPVGVNVGEACRGSGREIEGPLEEGSHLGAGDVPVGTEPGRLCATPDRHFQREEPIDERRPPEFGVHVDETRGVDGVRVGTVEDPDQPHRHLPALERLVGADQPFAALHADQHAAVSQSLEPRLMHTPVVVAEVPSVGGCFLGGRSVHPDSEHGPHRQQNQHRSHRGASPAWAAGRRGADVPARVHTWLHVSAFTITLVGMCLPASRADSAARRAG